MRQPSTLGARMHKIAPDMADQPRSERQLNLPVIIAGAVVALLGFGASVYLGTQGSGGGRAATQPVLVAARDISARATIGSSSLRVGSYASADVPPGALTRVGDATGKVALVDIKAGQPVLGNELGTSSSIVAPSEAYLPLPSGKVAATVPTGELVGVAGYIKSGDYIDIIAVVPARTGGFANVRTVYAGVLVIRTGLDNGSTADNPSAGSLTLAVTQCQAEYISWFLANASLKYSLLSSADYGSASQQATDAACPASSTGVTEADVKARWPGLIQ